MRRHVFVSICFVFVLAGCAHLPKGTPTEMPGEDWSVIYSEPGVSEAKTLEEKLDPEYWKKNDDDPLPPDDWMSGEPEDERVREWYRRNPYHNLSYYCLGVRDKKTRTFMSNPNPDDPTSPFSKNGENRITVEVLDDPEVSGTMELSLWDILRIGMFQRGFTLFGGEDFIKGLVRKAQKSRYFHGITKRGDTWESYSGYKPGGIFGIALRKRQPV